MFVVFVGDAGSAGDDAKLAQVQAPRGFWLRRPAREFGPYMYVCVYIYIYTHTQRYIDI